MWAALLAYEYIITFDRELRHIWQRKLSSATIIFVLNRYTVLALYFVNLVRYLNPASANCAVLVRVSQVLTILPYIVWASTYCTQVRTWLTLMLPNTPSCQSSPVSVGMRFRTVHGPSHWPFYSWRSFPSGCIS